MKIKILDNSKLQKMNDVKIEAQTSKIIYMKKNQPLRHVQDGIELCRKEGWVKIQYRSKVSRQSLASQSSSLETHSQFSKISRINSWVEFQDFQGESFEFPVEKLMSSSLDWSLEK